jgi:hypothetical protein
MKTYFYSFTLIFVFLVGILLSPCFSQKLDIEVKTDSYGGGKAPMHAAAVWIQKPGDELVNTVEVWSYQYNFCLKNWRTVTGLMLSGEYDGITQATVADHNTPLQVTWNCKDTAGNMVPNGSYEFCVEFAEDEYYWGAIDPNEEYHGKCAKGTIVIDDQAKAAYGDTSDTCFSGFKATYDPTIDIIYKAQKPVNRASLSYWYNSGMQKLTVTLHSLFDPSTVLHIVNVKGELIEAINIDAQSRECNWDLRDRSGRKVSSGIYIFEIHSADNRKHIRKPFTITLVR